MLTQRKKREYTMIWEEMKLEFKIVVNGKWLVNVEFIINYIT